MNQHIPIMFLSDFGVSSVITFTFSAQILTCSNHRHNIHYIRVPRISFFCWLTLGTKVYKLTLFRLKWLRKTGHDDKCFSCPTKLKPGDIIVSKPRPSGAKRRCVNCALRLGIITYRELSKKMVGLWIFLSSNNERRQQTRRVRSQRQNLDQPQSS